MEGKSYLLCRFASGHLLLNEAMEGYILIVTTGPDNWADYLEKEAGLQRAIRLSGGRSVRK